MDRSELIYAKVKELCQEGRRGKKQDSVLSKDGVLLTEVCDISIRWKEHIEELYASDEKSDSLPLEVEEEVDADSQGPDMLVEEILKAIHQLKDGKSEGSILGPMLFLLYVNSLPEAVQSSQVAMFADDTKVFKAIKSLSDSQDLQQDICNLVSWSDHARLQFNSVKCKAQHITRKISPITFEYDMNGSRIDTVSAVTLDPTVCRPHEED